MVNHMANSDVLDRTFAACSHPIRRGILERLTEGELSVGEATRDFGVSKPAISRHLKVLEEAGTIVRVIDGRTHRLRISESSLLDAAAWMTGQRELWSESSTRSRSTCASSATTIRERSGHEPDRYSDPLRGAHIRCARRGGLRRLDEPRGAQAVVCGQRGDAHARGGGRPARRRRLPAVDGRRRRGTVHTVHGQYSEVSRPDRLVYSWCWEQGGDENPHVSTVDVRFLGEGERTTVVLEHSGLQTPESVVQHRHGWEGCVANLQARVFAGAAQAS